LYRLVLLLALCLAAPLVAGCATHSPEEEAKSAAEIDDAKCKAAGLQPGTHEFERCLQKLADQRAQADADSKAALASRLLGRPPEGFDTGMPPH
jgi:hypothetical protein